MRSIVIAVVATFLGCAAQPGYMWKHHSHADKAQFDKDRAQCEYEAAQGTASYSQGATARTYSGAVAQGIGEGFTIASRRAELGVLCMKAKGYTQHPIDDTVIR